MCGICGLVTVKGEPESARVDAMRAALVHRGPDDGSTEVFGRCALGHQRLRVLDLETGYQPVASEAGDVVAVFNGELYNYRELRADLSARGHALRGTGDTVVIPHLYEEHGPRFVERLHGMFAVALWDARRDRLVLARDRIGKKPLLWTRLADGTLAFASELKGLLALPELEREVDVEAIDGYLALQYVPRNRTGLEGVSKLPPGHLLVAENGTERVEPYWSLEPAGERLTDEEWLERVRETVRAAVRRRLAADVPLGALLSGGIDSSVVVALIAEASREPVRTFTVGFPDEAYDERRYARAVAERYGTAHHELVVEVDPTEAVLRLAETLDEPLGDEAVLPTFLISELARREVTVALTGDGGDESFAGYERYLAHALAARLPPAAALAGRALRAFPSARAEPRSPLFRAARFLDVSGTPAAERYGRLMEVFPAALRARLYRDGLPQPRPASDWLGQPPLPGLAGLQLLDATTYLPGALLPKADLASMAHSLELRSPLLDHEVLELGVSLPAHLKARGRRGKIALRRAFGPLLPADVAGRGKTGFGVPIGRWLREDLRELAGDVLLGPTARSRGWFDVGTVEALLREHRERRRDHAHRLWCLLVLELWQRTHVDARPQVTPVASVRS